MSHDNQYISEEMSLFHPNPSNDSTILQANFMGARKDAIMETVPLHQLCTSSYQMLQQCHLTNLVVVNKYNAN